MPILNLNHVSLYYEEFGRGDRYLIQAQQFVNSHIYYTKDLADRCGFHASSSEFGAMPLLHGHRGPGRRLV